MPGNTAGDKHRPRKGPAARKSPRNEIAEADNVSPLVLRPGSGVCRMSMSDGDTTLTDERLNEIWAEKLGGSVQRKPRAARSSFRVARTTHHQIVDLLRKAVHDVSIDDPADWHGVLSLVMAVGATASDLAKRTGVSVATVSRWKNGLTTPATWAREPILAAALEALSAASAEGGLMPFRDWDLKTGKVETVARARARHAGGTSAAAVPLSDRASAGGGRS